MQADLVDPAEFRLKIGSQRGPGGIVGAKRFDEGMVGPAVQGPVPLSSNKKTVSIQELRSSDSDKIIFINLKAIIERKVLTADQRRVSAVIGGRSEKRVD